MSYTALVTFLVSLGSAILVPILFKDRAKH